MRAGAIFVLALVMLSALPALAVERTVLIENVTGTG